MAENATRLPKRPLLFSACALVLGACQNSDQEPKHSPAAPPSRVVVIGPSSAETLVWLGLNERVVGVSDYCVDPSLTELPRVGGQMDPNLERIASLDPDLVIVQGAHPRVESWCAANQVRYSAQKTQSVQAWLDEVRDYAEIFDVNDAEDRIQSWKGEFAQHAAASATRPRVLLVASRSTDGVKQVLAAGNGSFLGELIEHAGGENAFSDHARDYFDLSEETLPSLAPELILELNSGQSDEERLMEWRSDFPMLPAVRNGHVYGLTEDYVFLPGPRMLQTAALIRQKISLLE